MTKFVPCISANASGFVTVNQPSSRALIIMPRRNHADYVRACEAYTAANDMGIRPSIQQCLTLMALIRAMEVCDAMP
jgi:hypothetical protein